MTKVPAGTIGFRFLFVFEKVSDNVRSVLDISDYVTLTAVFTPPSGSTSTKTLTLTNTGSDGKAQYVTASGSFLAVAGLWSVQATYTGPQGTLPTFPVTFEVV